MYYYTRSSNAVASHRCMQCFGSELAYGKKTNEILWEIRRAFWQRAPLHCACVRGCEIGIMVVTFSFIFPNPSPSPLLLFYHILKVCLLARKPNTRLPTTSPTNKVAKAPVPYIPNLLVLLEVSSAFYWSVPMYANQSYI